MAFSEGRNLTVCGIISLFIAAYKYSDIHGRAGSVSLPSSFGSFGAAV